MTACKAICVCLCAYYGNSASVIFPQFLNLNDVRHL